MLADDDAALGRQQARQQKLRVTRYVEELIPKDVLDRGTLIMVMQVDSPVNGSALQTVISLVFPLTDANEETKELIRGIRESGKGGTFRTIIYRPLIDVTRDDVLDAFPTQFPGGRRTMERICYRARDCTIAHIEQEMGEADIERKRELAKFVIKSLKKYIERDCVAPEIGKPFPPDTAHGDLLNDDITSAVTEYMLPTKLEKKSKRARSKPKSPSALKTPPHDLSDSEGSDPFANLDQSGETKKTANGTIDAADRIDYNHTKKHQALRRTDRLRTHEIFSTRKHASHATEEFAIPARGTRSEAGAHNTGNIEVGNILEDLNIARSFG